MKQLHVVGGFPVGTHTFVLWQVAGAMRAGHQVKVLAAKTGNDIGYRLADELNIDPGLAVYADYRKCPAWTWSRARLSRAVRDAAQSEVFGRILAERRKTFFCRLLAHPEVAGTQLVQAHFIGWATEVGIPLARLLNVPVVVTAHSPVAETALWQMRYVQEHADAVVVVSESERQSWIECTGSDRKLVRVWNGASYSGASYRGPEADAPVRLVGVGRLSPEKRVTDLIVAVAHLRDMRCEVELALFGDGPMRAEVEALVKDLGLTGRVRLHGLTAHAEVMQHVARSHVFVHAAERETFGVALIEAMGLGVPVVAARSSGAVDVVIDRETGFLVRSRDTRALAARVAELTVDSALRQRMGRAAKERFDREFSIEAHMKNMERVWSLAMTRRATVPAAPQGKRG